MTIQEPAVMRPRLGLRPDTDVEVLLDPWWKRPLDIVGAAALLLLAAPIWAAAAIAIKLDSPGPVLYVQDAVGRGGRTFRFHKLRTMTHGADGADHRRYIRSFVQGATGENGVHKMTTDARRTRVGRWLRRLSLDELPQALDVLRGEMSLVGPRPPLPYEYALYDELARRRLAVKPGMTGLYQVTRRSRASFREMVEIDLQYAQRRSLWLDLWIILATLPAMLSGKGAY